MYPVTNQMAKEEQALINFQDEGFDRIFHEALEGVCQQMGRKILRISDGLLDSEELFACHSMEALSDLLKKWVRNSPGTLLLVH